MKQSPKQQFLGLVNQDEGTAFGVSFPDVPGCFSASDDMDGLLQNAKEALALHLEGEDVPEPRSLVDFHNDPDVKQALSEGASILVVPFNS